MSSEILTLRAKGVWAAVDYLVPLAAIGFALYQIVGATYWGVALVIFGPIFLYGVLRLWNLAMRKAVLTPTRLDYFNGFGWRGVDRVEVEGWRQVSNRSGTWYRLVPKTEGAKEISIPQWLFLHPAAQDWFAGMGDVVPGEKAEAEAALEVNPAFGRDKTERLRRKATLQIWVTLTAFPVFLLFFFGMLSDWQFVWVPIVFVLLPPAGLALDRLYPCQFRLGWEGGNRDVRPTLVGLVGAPCVALLFAAFSAVHILDAAQLLWLGTAAALFPAAYVLWRGPALRRVWPAVIVFVAATAWTCGVLALVNEYADNGPYRLYPVRVLRLSHDRGYSYTIGPWGPQRYPESYSATPKRYGELHPGDVVCITAGRGALGIGWYKIDACPHRVPGMSVGS